MSLKQPVIYLDYASTTPVDPRVIESMLPFLGPTGQFGNPHTGHYYGRQAGKAVEYAQEQVSKLINAPPATIIWTSGATESINLALKGIMHFYHEKGRHFITLKTEHSASLASCKQLEREGFIPTYLEVEKNGLLNLDQLERALRSDTILVSLMHVNNETGVIQNIDHVSQILKARGVFFHVDAAQSVGKIPIDVANIPVDLLSFSAHKIYGPKGIGVLYLRVGLNLKPQIHGGNQQYGLRSGTLPCHQIVGMGTACCLADNERKAEIKRITQLNQLFWGGLKGLDNIECHGHPKKRVPHIVNVSFLGLKNSILLPALRGLAVTSGSACQTGTTEISHVLQAMGVNQEIAKSAIRFSFGRFTTQTEIESAVSQIYKTVTFLRSL